jgi:hypothetical protein
MDEDKNPENLYDQEAFGIRLAVIPAGSFENEEGVKIDYGNRIKIQQGRFSLKLTALQALGLSRMLSDVAFVDSIHEWAVVEKAQKVAEMSQLDF